MRKGILLLAMAMAMALALIGCGAAVGVGGGGSLASVTVNRATPATLRSAVATVFAEEGFTRAGETENSMRFSKQGGRGSEMMWKSLMNDNPVMIRPTVSWIWLGGGRAEISCDVEVAQESNVFGETVHDPMLMGKEAYAGLLRKVRARVEAGTP